ncbi:helix-turn-helix DNA binding protein [Microbacterium phage Tempo]|nr:helix-turn-helix DNA binding protein [Microbacterium phage Tempo]QKO02763.1 helix-turn-helix DNA binding domain protein [Microbacterium phage Kelcole]UOW92756.1 DNA binding protein [Microbacterium phage RobinRose]WNN94039.1 helix-turn-helix DNA binding domain protein [Microbacterium phage Fregley]
MTTNTDDPLLTPKETAAMLGVELNTLRWWRSIDKGPAPTKLGYRTVRYRRSTVLAYAASREQRADG